MFKYSGDFYVWVLFCFMPSIGFIYALLNSRSRPWAMKAIEDADDKPHQIDLTFLVALVFGWLIANACLIGLGLHLFEGKDMMLFCGECLGAVTLCWGLNKVANRISTPKKENDDTQK
jgi:hypothetical protein